MNQHHRYTGPELSELLAQVREELGANASIVEANKFRSGGLAGFFASEQFEVVATGPGSGNGLELAPLPEGANYLDPLDLDAEHIDVERIEAAARMDADQRETTILDSGGGVSGGGVSTALLDRADSISIQERIGLSRPGQSMASTTRRAKDALVDDRPASWFDDSVVVLDPQEAAALATPTPTSTPPDMRTPPELRTRTETVTDAAAAEPVARPGSWFADVDLAAPIHMADAATGVAERPADVDLTQTDTDTITRQPQSQSAQATPTRFGDILANELQQADLSVSSTSTDEFWERVDSFERSFVSRDLVSQIVIVVGNVRSGLAVARQIEVDEADVPRALVVMTEAPDAVDLPDWQIHQNSGELRNRLQYWISSNRSGIVVIDSDLGSQAAAYIETVRSAGSRLLRVALDDEMSPKSIFSLLQSLGGNVVVDLTFRAAPLYLLNLLDHGVPVASVEGRSVDSRLVLAVANEVRRG